MRWLHSNPHDERNTKRCRKCGETKSVTDFPWNKRDGNYTARCYACKREYAREYWRAHYSTGGPFIHWTTERDGRLLSCIVAGMTLAEAAADLGMSKTAIACRRSRCGFPKFKRDHRIARPSWPAERVAQLKQLRDAGDTFDVCAAVLGTTRGAIASAVSVYLRSSS